MLLRMFRSSQIRALTEAGIAFAIAARWIGSTELPAAWRNLGVLLAGIAAVTWAAVRLEFATTRRRELVASAATALTMVPISCVVARLFGDVETPAVARIASIAGGAFLLVRTLAFLPHTARIRGRKSIAWGSAAEHARVAVGLLFVMSILAALATSDAPWLARRLPAPIPTSTAASTAPAATVVRISAALALWLGGAAILGVPLALLASWRAALRSNARLRRLADVADHFEGEHGTVVVRASGADELAVLERSFNRLAARVAKLSADRRGWLAASARALVDPVRAVRGRVDALADHAAEAGLLPRGLKDLGALEQELTRFERSLADLVNLSDAEHTTASVAVAPLLRTVVERERDSAWQSDRVTVVLADAPEDLTVEGDRDRLRHALAHLVENAVRHSAAGDLVRIAALRENGHVRIDVARAAAVADVIADDGSTDARPTKHFTLFLPAAS